LGLALVSSAAAQGLRVGGQVVDAQHQPIAGAELRLRPLPSAYALDRALLEGSTSEDAPRPGGGASARSDGEGRFQLDAPKAGMWLLTAAAKGRIEAALFLAPLLAPTELPPILLEVAREVRVEVVDGGGRPVSGARVVLDARPGRRFLHTLSADLARPWPRRQTGLTGETGLALLGAPESGDYQLQVVAEGFAPWSEDHRSGTTERVVLRRGTPRGLVVRNPAGDPVPEVLVRLESGRIPLTLTDAQGRATLGVPRDHSLGLRILSVEGGEAGATLRGEALAAPPEIVVEPPFPVIGLVLAAPARTPVAGAVVWSGSDPTSFAYSDERGRYRLPLRPSGTETPGEVLFAAAPGYFRVSSQLSTPRGEHPDSAFVLPPAATVQGRVLDREGRPLAGAAVRWLDSTSQAPSQAPRVLSGRDGRFVVAPLALNRTLRLQARREGYTPTVVEVPPVTGRQGVDIVIRMPEGRSAFGSVVNEADRPIPAASITLTPASERLGSGEPHPEPIRARSGERGRFELEGVTPGAFDLRAEASGFAPVTVPGLEIPATGRRIDLGTLVLPEEVRLEGRVTDSGGNPLELAEIRIQASLPRANPGEPGLALPDAVSDGDGRFGVAGLAAGRAVELRVARAGYAPATVRGVHVPSDRLLEIVLEDAVILRGRVVDERGDPVAAARLQLVAEPASLGDRLGRASASPMRFASTDGAGSFEIRGVTAGRWDLTVRADGFQNGGREGLEIPAAEEPEEIRIVLREGAVVRGRVVGAGGEPVAAAQVSALGGSRPPFRSHSLRSATTDSDGRYRLDGLPTRQMTFAVEHPKYRRQARDLEVRAGGNRLDFELEDSWEISGRVVDAEGGPASGARVRAVSTSGVGSAGSEAREPVLTAGDGGFTIRIPAQGQYIVRAEKSGYAPAQTDEAVRIEGQSVYGIELRLGQGGAIAGRVTGLDLDELSRVRILALQPGRFAPPAMGQTDYEGLYRLENLPPGEWMVLAVVGDMGKNVRETVTLEPGAEEVTLDLELGGGSTLSGQVVQGSKPVPGARVQAIAVEGLSGSSAVTDQAGRFRLEELDSGTYTVLVSAFTHAPEHQEEVQLDGDREVTIELEAHTLRGRVLDALEGTPIPGARVALTRRGREGSGQPTVLRTDTRGAFRFTGMAPGPYHLRVSQEGYGNAGTEVGIDEGGGAPAVEIRLEPSEALTLYVLHPTGAPATEVTLMALDTTGQPLLQGWYVAGEGGRIRLADLPAGTWTLLAAGRGTASVSQRVETPGGPVTLRLPESGGLAVHVPVLAGSGRRARLTLRDPRGQPYRDIRTGQAQWELLEGAATVPLLPVGVWTVEARTVAGELIGTTAGRVVLGRVLDVIVE
jgi:protocatechuate 3,4-dioxygenase beta subunit